MIRTTFEYLDGQYSIEIYPNTPSSDEPAVGFTVRINRGEMEFNILQKDFAELVAWASKYLPK